MTISLRLPVAGLAVKRMPATSEGTMICTTTAIATLFWSRPFWWRYEIACGFQRLAQQLRTAATTASAPVTLRNVSCCPAKLSPGRSSAVADERTATAGSPGSAA